MIPFLRHVPAFGGTIAQVNNKCFAHISVHNYPLITIPVVTNCFRSVYNANRRRYFWNQSNPSIGTTAIIFLALEPAHKLKIDQNKLQNCRSNILNLVNVL
ncbi:hypothetical protein D1AOALGA4SA_550 [Olavius algarvensis Delta 1 endosymbiont]|nr:hypothetical protein D1AOALGA4SA_550 [Olavius algarvensis Delta 1 endosymbiont]